jgi:hypothetical protein
MWAVVKSRAGGDKGEWEIVGWITWCFSSPIGVWVAISSLSSEMIGDIAGDIRDGELQI